MTFNSRLKKVWVLYSGNPIEDKTTKFRPTSSNGPMPRIDFDEECIEFIDRSLIAKLIEQIELHTKSSVQISPGALKCSVANVIEKFKDEVLNAST